MIRNWGFFFHSGNHGLLSSRNDVGKSSDIQDTCTNWKILEKLPTLAWKGHKNLEDFHLHTPRQNQKLINPLPILCLLIGLEDSGKELTESCP